MIRASLLAGAALLAALPALAQEGGEIRTGEHVGFTRVVMVIEPATEWSLETAAGRATIFFPGKALGFTTSGVFDRIPRTRVQAVRSGTDAAGTTVEVDLGCDCRISASFVGARHLALDIADRDAPRAPDATALLPDAAVIPEKPESAEARAQREATVVASAEQMLIEQITRAAGQGLIQLEATTPAAVEARAAAPGSPAPGAPEAVPPPPAPEPAFAVAAAEPEAALARLLDHDQIEATTVFDRDSRALGARVAVAAAPLVCVADDALDVGRWSNGLPLHRQAPDLSQRIVGEFDTPDPLAVRDLVRLYIHFGFGAEAESLIGSFAVPIEHQALLIDLARAVEGRTVAVDGPLALPDVCPGRHGLWLALGGGAPAFRDEAQFATVQSAFAELPVDLRMLVGPMLIARLLDADRPAEARLIAETTTRQGAAPTAALRLQAARLEAAEGRPREGVRALSALIEGNAPNAVEALGHLVELALDENLPIPQRLVTDLRAAAVLNRHAPGEVPLRALLIQALAHADDLPAAIDEVRRARADLPEAEAFAPLGVAVLAEADPARVGPGAYAEVVLGGADLVDAAPAGDPARRAIAGRLLDLGLPNAALAWLAPAIGRGDAAARLIAAEAHLRLGAPAPTLAVLTDLGGPEAAGLRARALALGGDFTAAAAVLGAEGLTAQADPYAWPAGDWQRARDVAGDPVRLALAAFMAARTEPQAAEATLGPRPNPDRITPEQAFQAPLPQLRTPSLSAARTLLSNGRQVDGFVQELLDAP